RRAAPVDAAERIPGGRGAVLPEAVAGARLPAAMLAQDQGRGQTLGGSEERRQGLTQPFGPGPDPAKPLRGGRARRLAHAATSRRSRRAAVRSISWPRS